MKKNYSFITINICEVVNLAIVSLRENAVINKNKLCFKNAELRKIGINIVRAKNKIADVKKRSE